MDKTTEEHRREQSEQSDGVAIQEQHEREIEERVHERMKGGSGSAVKAITDACSRATLIQFLMRFHNYGCSIKET